MSEAARNADALVFPNGFLWGAATSAHQTEGLNRNTDWWRSEQAGRVPHRSGVACDAWHRWREDLEILRALGLNTYRMSVEWARIEPTPGKVDRGALDHYRTIVEAVRAAGVEPIVTLHHFSNPLWLSDGGAWVRRSVVDRFAAYADLVAGHLGDLVTWWVTINEPTVFGLFGYISGAWPPHRRNDFAATYAMSDTRSRATRQRVERSRPATPKQWSAWRCT